MRIIGQAGSSRDKIFIVEADEKELAQMHGFAARFVWDRDEADVRPLEPGTHIPIGPIYEAAVEALETHKSALAAARSLKAAGTRFLKFFANDTDGESD